MTSSGKLVMLKGRHRGLKITLSPTHFLIGRDEACHLRPVSSAVSRHHCAIAPSASGYVLRDLQSANGTYVNGSRVSGTVRLTDGDQVEIGPLQFRFQDCAERGANPLSGESIQALFDEANASLLDPETETAEFTSTSFEVENGVVQTDAAACDENNQHIADHVVGGPSLRDYLRRPPSGRHVTRQ